MAEVVLLVDDLKLLSASPRCRICHEEEFESVETLEAPCACSGTVKVSNHIVHNFLILSTCFSVINLFFFLEFFFHFNSRQ